MQTAISTSDLLDTADRIGHRLCETALWSGKSCTWTIFDVPEVGPPQPILAGGNIYSGSSGIALFLGELGKLTGSTSLRRVAEGALRHSMDSVEIATPKCEGLYLGWPGIVLAAARFAHLWNSDEFASAAQTAYSRAYRREPVGSQTDVVFGAAGTILALICASEYVQLDEVMALITSRGDHLLEAALRRPNGWSWHTITTPVADDLLGYAHGTAGIAHAMRELAIVTGNTKYSFAADEAFRYERIYFDSAAGAWPDLRYKDYPPPPAVLDRRMPVPIGHPARALQRTRLPYTWCHGAPGIGLARLRSMSIERDSNFAEDASVASLSTARWDDTQGAVYCLCHGYAGNAEFLMEASAQLDAPALRYKAERRAMRGREQFELCGRPWPTHARVNGDPSLMTGEAGIGYFYLRMADTAVPSILALEPRCRLEAPTDQRGYFKLRDENVDALFGASLDLFTTRAGARARARSRIHEAARTGPIHHAALHVLVGNQQRRKKGSVTEMQAKVLRRDYAHAELLALPFDTGDRTHVVDASLEACDVPWSDIKIQLAPDVRIVDALRSISDNANGECKNELLMRRKRSVRCVALSRLSALVLGACDTKPLTVSEILRVIVESTALTHEARSHLSAAVHALVLSAWRSGIVLLWRDA